MTEYLIDPEVPGSLADDNTYEKSSAGRHLAVDPVHFVFDGWMGDDLINTSGHWFVTTRLANALRDGGYTGFELREARTSKSEDFTPLAIVEELPTQWERLVPTGALNAGDDVSSASGIELAITERLLRLLLTDFSVTNAMLDTVNDDTDDDELLTLHKHKVEQFHADLNAESKKARSEGTDRNAQLTEEINARIAAFNTPIEPPTVKTPTKATITGDLTLAIKAIKQSIDSPEVLTLMKNFGPYDAEEFSLAGTGQIVRCVAESTAARIDFAKDAVIEIMIECVKPSGVASERQNALLGGAAIGTQSEELELFGNPKSITDNSKYSKSAGFSGYKKYSIARRTVIVYWEGDQFSRVVVR